MRSPFASALGSHAGWQQLVMERRSAIGDFLTFASSAERAGRSLRFSHRADLDRVRLVLPWFEDPWWGVAVYTCFDSVPGTRTAVDAGFAQPPDARTAAELVANTTWPRGSVRNHRAMATVTRATQALVALCENTDAVREVLVDESSTFDERFHDLLGPAKVKGWGRTAAFDLLARAGQLGVSARSYLPDRAYLAGSTGPARGFRRVFDVPVTAHTASDCEEVLHRWTERWSETADAVGVSWEGPPYTSADFENALCVFQGE